ncbi:MAG: hypothetical protein Q7R92_01255 [bacterium]|nr:hypothetical protein [bacterium]
MRHLRRMFLAYFRTEYVKKQILSRKGECGHHGCCGDSPWSWFFTRKCLKGKDCLKWSNLPYYCKLYPIDEKDKAPKTKKYCNFYWD